MCVAPAFGLAGMAASGNRTAQTMLSPIASALLPRKKREPVVDRNRILYPNEVG